MDDISFGDQPGNSSRPGHSFLSSLAGAADSPAKLGTAADASRSRVQSVFVTADSSTQPDATESKLPGSSKVTNAATGAYGGSSSSSLARGLHSGAEGAPSKATGHAVAEASKQRLAAMRASRNGATAAAAAIAGLRAAPRAGRDAPTRSVIAAVVSPAAAAGPPGGGAAVPNRYKAAPTVGQAKQLRVSNDNSLSVPRQDPVRTSGTGLAFGSRVTPAVVRTSVDAMPAAAFPTADPSSGTVGGGGAAARRSSSAMRSINAAAAAGIAAAAAKAKLRLGGANGPPAGPAGSVLHSRAVSGQARGASPAPVRLHAPSVAATPAAATAAASAVTAATAALPNGPSILHSMPEHAVSKGAARASAAAAAAARPVAAQEHVVRPLTSTFNVSGHKDRYQTPERNVARSVVAKPVAQPSLTLGKPAAYPPAGASVLAQKQPLRPDAGAAATSGTAAQVPSQAKQFSDLADRLGRLQPAAAAASAAVSRPLVPVLALHKLGASVSGLLGGGIGSSNNAPGFTIAEAQQRLQQLDRNAEACKAAASVEVKPAAAEQKPVGTFFTRPQGVAQAAAAEEQLPEPQKATAPLLMVPKLDLSSVLQQQQRQNEEEQAAQGAPQGGPGSVGAGSAHVSQGGYKSGSSKPGKSAKSGKSGKKGAHAGGKPTPDNEAEQQEQYYMYQKMSVEERQAMERSIATLPQTQRRVFQKLWRDFQTARENTEKMAFRGHRLLDQVTNEYRNYREEMGEQMQEAQQEVLHLRHEILVRDEHIAQQREQHLAIMSAQQLEQQQQQQQHLLQAQHSVGVSAQESLSQMSSSGYLTGQPSAGGVSGSGTATGLDGESSTPDVMHKARMIAGSATAKILLSKVVAQEGVINAQAQEMQDLKDSFGQVVEAVVVLAKHIKEEGAAAAAAGAAGGEQGSQLTAVKKPPPQLPDDVQYIVDKVDLIIASAQAGLAKCALAFGGNGGTAVGGDGSSNGRGPVGGGADAPAYGKRARRASAVVLEEGDIQSPPQQESAEDVGSSYRPNGDLSSVFRGAEPVDDLSAPHAVDGVYAAEAAVAATTSGQGTAGTRSTGVVDSWTAVPATQLPTTAVPADSWSAGHNRVQQQGGAAETYSPYSYSSIADRQAAPPAAKAGVYKEEVKPTAAPAAQPHAPVTGSGTSPAVTLAQLRAQYASQQQPGGATAGGVTASESLAELRARATNPSSGAAAAATAAAAAAAAAAGRALEPHMLPLDKLAQLRASLAQTGGAFTTPQPAHAASELHRAPHTTAAAVHGDGSRADQPPQPRRLDAALSAAAEGPAAADRRHNLAHAPELKATLKLPGSTAGSFDSDASNMTEATKQLTGGSPWVPKLSLAGLSRVGAPVAAKRDTTEVAVTAAAPQHAQHDGHRRARQAADDAMLGVDDITLHLNEPEAGLQQSPSKVAAVAHAGLSSGDTRVKKDQIQ